MSDRHNRPGEVDGRTLRAMFDSEPARWIGFLVALGVLLPIALWFVSEQMSARVRDAVVVTSALMLVVFGAFALSRTATVGYALGGSGFFDEDDDAVRQALLALLGLAIGLGISVVMLALARDEPVEAVVEADEDEESLPPIEGDTETIGDEPATRWSSHVVDTAPATPLPVDSTAITLALVALGLAVPLFSSQSTTRLSGLDEDVTASSVAAYVLFGVMTGLGLLLPALALRVRSAVAVASAFGIVALGTGIAYAWPDTFFNESWLMLGTGLGAGILLPAFVRALPMALVRDTTSVAAGILASVLLFVTATGLATHGAQDGSIDFSSGVDVEDDDDSGDVIVPAVPSPPAFPTDYPTFTYPTDFPSFVVPTFDYPSFSVPTAP
jgi:hypothetical protein